MSGAPPFAIARTNQAGSGKGAFMALVLEQSIDVPSRPDAVVVADGALWVAGEGAGRLRRFSTKGKPEAIREEQTLSIGVLADGGITRMDGKLLVATARTRILTSVDPETGGHAIVLDCKTLVGGKNAGGLRASNGTIAGIVWREGTVWVAVAAGYASCIVQIDIAAGKIISDFWAPGPNPRGLAFDAKRDRFWVIEGRKEALADLDRRGEWLGTSAPLPLPGMRRLSIDSENSFWAVDAKLARIYRMRMEG